MMVVMSPEAGEAEIQAVVGRLETTGVHVMVLPGELTTAIGAIGDPEGVAELGRSAVPTSWPRPSWPITSRPWSRWPGGGSAGATRSA